MLIKEHSCDALPWLARHPRGEGAAASAVQGAGSQMQNQFLARRAEGSVAKPYHHYPNVPPARSQYRRRRAHAHILKSLSNILLRVHVQMMNDVPPAVASGTSI